MRFRRKARKVEELTDGPTTPPRGGARAPPAFTPPRRAICVRAVSLGAGRYEKNGTVSSFTPRPHIEKSAGASSTESFKSLVDTGTTVLLFRKPTKATTSKTSTSPSLPSLKQSMYIRVADLGQLLHDPLHLEHEEAHPHFHCASNHVSFDQDSREMYVALDDGLGSHTPIAPYAIEALAEYGLNTALDKSMWKLVKSGGKSSDLQLASWQTKGFLNLDFSRSEVQNDIAVWSGSFQHDFYGGELPAIRSCGCVGLSPINLCELLIDSGRVKEYNKLSLGRENILVLQDDLSKGGAVTKVMSSRSKPPMIRKVLEFVSILHARKLPDGQGYLILTRAVSQLESLSRRTLDTNIMRSEILMGVNVLRSIEGNPDSCLMINVNHLRSPMVPMMIAKKIGLTRHQTLFKICEHVPPQANMHEE